VGATYALLLAQCSLRYVPYATMSNEWALLNLYFKCLGATYALLLAQCSLSYAPMLVCAMRGCFSAPYAMFLMLIFQMSGCYLRTAFGAVLLTLCSLCLYVK